MAPPIIKPRISSNAIAFSELCLALNTSEYSKPMLAEIVGVNLGTIITWMKYLHKRKLVFICEYRRNHQIGAPESIWTWGFEEKDVPRPKAKTQAEYSKTYRAKKQRKLLNDIARTAS